MTCALLRRHDIGEEDRNNSNNYHSDLHVSISSNAAPAFIGRTFYAFSVCDPICKWFCRHQSHSSYRDSRPTPIGYCTHRILVTWIGRKVQCTYSHNLYNILCVFALPLCWSSRYGEGELWIEGVALSGQRLCMHSFNSRRRRRAAENKLCW